MTTYVILSGLGGELARRKVQPGDTVSNTLYLALARDCWDLSAGDVIRIEENDQPDRDNQGGATPGASSVLSDEC